MRLRAARGVSRAFLALLGGLAVGALLLAGPLFTAPEPGGVLVVDFSSATDYSGDPSVARRSRDLLLRELRKMNAEVRVVDFRATKLLWVRNAQDVVGWNGSTGTGLWQGDVVVLAAWKVGIDARFDSLTRGSTTAGTWPNKPLLAVGPTNYGSGKWTQTSSCSTGISSNNGVVAVPAGGYAFYNLQGDQVWRTGAAQMIRAAAASRPAGTFKGLIGYGLARNAVNGSGYQNCSDCDYVVRETAAAAESVMVWERGRSTSETAPLIFCDLGSSYRAELGLIGLSRLDGASGGKVSRKTIRLSVMVATYFRTDKYDGSLNPVAPGMGPFVPASGTVDTLNQFDSADSIRYSGIKLSVPVQVHAESLRAMMYQGRILARMGSKAKLTIQDYSGTDIAYSSGWFSAVGRGVMKGERANWQMINDVWGVTRTRTWIKPGVGGTCAQGDTAAPCLLQFSFARAESLAKALGLAGVDRVVWAPSMDWTPTDVTRTDARKLYDSVLVAMVREKVKGVLVSPYVMDSSPSAYRSPATHPIGWGNDAGTFYVRDAAGNPIGQVARLATRGFEGLASQDPGQMHDLLGEFLNGWLSDFWFAGSDNNVAGTPALNFYHDLQHPFQVLAVTANSLGGTGDGTQARRPGWWAIKGVAHVQSCANSYGHPSHKIAEIVWPEELATEVIQ